MNIITSLLRRAERRRALGSLLHLDDHLLRDIGVTRSDLHVMMHNSRSARLKANRGHE
jgi:uncharacterized protein YjiS (DUF1127 family)